MARPKSFLLVALLGFASSSLAHAACTTQFHARTGYIAGQFSGLFSGHFKLNAAFDLEFETFFNHDTAYLFRFIQGYDSPESRPYYTYMGGGVRHYFWGRGEAEEQTTDNMVVNAWPTVRAYFGGDAGISQVLVRSFGPTVQAVANMLDVGGNVGLMYQITRKLGIEAQAGVTFGYGMSSTYANGFTERLLLGGTYFF